MLGSSDDLRPVCGSGVRVRVCRCECEWERCLYCSERVGDSDEGGRRMLGLRSGLFLRENSARALLCGGRAKSLWTKSRREIADDTHLCGPAMLARRAANGAEKSPVVLPQPLRIRHIAPESVSGEIRRQSFAARHSTSQTSVFPPGVRVRSPPAAPSPIATSGKPPSGQPARVKPTHLRRREVKPYITPALCTGRVCSPLHHLLPFDTSFTM